MSDAEFPEKPSGSLLGKEFIIVLVIIFSGLSFTLGYFVGKSGGEKPAPVLQAVEPSAPVQKPEVLPVPPSPAAAVLPEKQAQETVSPIARPAEQQTAKETGTVQAEIRKKIGKQDPPPVQQKTTDSPAVTPAADKTMQKAESAPAQENRSIVYTVQIGAFRNIAEAKQLKAKFEKKGYKSFISAGKNKKSQKIFKVKSGEFREKKDAEVLALKLRKTEGLQTYVTLKSE